MDDSDEDEKVEEEDYEIASDAEMQSDHDTDEVNNFLWLVIPVCVPQLGSIHTESHAISYTSEIYL